MLPSIEWAAASGVPEPLAGSLHYEKLATLSCEGGVITQVARNKQTGEEVAIKVVGTRVSLGTRPIP